MNPAAARELSGIQRGFTNLTMAQAVHMGIGIVFHEHCASGISVVFVVTAVALAVLQPLVKRMTLAMIRLSLRAKPRLADDDLVRFFGAYCWFAATPLRLATFLLFCVHMLESEWMAFVIGVGLLVVTNVALFPTYERAEHWLARERELFGAARGDHEPTVGNPSGETDMHDEFPDPTIQKQLLGLKIVIGALFVGCAIFAGIAVFVQNQFQFQMMGGFPALSIVGIGMALTILVIRPFVLKSSLQATRKKLSAEGEPTEEMWIRVYGGQLITGAALLEGPAFFFLIAYMLEHQWWALAAGIALMLLMLLWHFPTNDRWERWLVQQMEAVQSSKCPE